MNQEQGVLAGLCIVVALVLGQQFWPAENADRLKSDLQFLASDELKGRATGSPEEVIAATFVADRFRSLGLDSMGLDGYHQIYHYRPHPNLAVHGAGDSATLGMSHVQEIEGRNVAGFLDNGKAHTIVIGAHHDHLGMGDENSLFRGSEPAVHNGADDNASGVVTMLHLAERIAARKDLKYNYLFLSFSGEEKGLWGSKHWVTHPTVPLASIHGMINLDMVGRMAMAASDSVPEDKVKVLAIYGNGTSPFWTSACERANSDLQLNLVFDESGVGPSDHTSFYLEDIPVLHFFTGQHPDYHKPSDDEEKISYEGIRAVAAFIDAVVLQMDAHDKLVFTKTVDQEKSDTPAFKVTLGVIPDYLFQGEGMRIDGVSDGRPAANAGMERGDVVVRMGDHPVTDMQTYMEGLGKFEAGQKTPVAIQRNGDLVTFEVTWD